MDKSRPPVIVTLVAIPCGFHFRVVEMELPTEILPDMAEHDLSGIDWGERDPMTFGQGRSPLLAMADYCLKADQIRKLNRGHKA